MKSLETSDLHHLQAAEGWLELGNHLEANEELEKITPQVRAHPMVLVVRWKIYAQARKWDVCVDLAEALVKLAPDDPFGWIHRSYALHELKRTQEAWDRLLPAVEKFPSEWTIPYNLACYACQLGNLPEAKRWLQKALQIEDASKLKLMALDDPDLEPLWKNIGEI